MKNALLLTLTIFLFACGGRNAEAGGNTTATTNDTLPANDSLKSRVKLFSEMLNMSGNIHELKTYQIGKFKNLSFEVSKIRNVKSNDFYVFGLLKVKYSDDYWYYQRFGVIDAAEILGFIETLDLIKNDYINTIPDTETAIGYISYGDVRVVARYENGKWQNNLNTNYREDKSAVKFVEEDISALQSLFRGMSAKIDSLSVM